MQAWCVCFCGETHLHLPPSGQDQNRGCSHGVQAEQPKVHRSSGSNGASSDVLDPMTSDPCFSDQEECTCSLCTKNSTTERVSEQTIRGSENTALWI